MESFMKQIATLSWRYDSAFFNSFTVDFVTFEYNWITFFLLFPLFLLLLFY